MNRLEVDKVCEYIDDFHCYEGGLPDRHTLAQRFHYSPSQFSRLFKSYMQLSVREYLASKKIEKSIKSILKQNSVTHALNEAGYTSTSSFSRTFKQCTGLSPRSYKRNIHSLQKFVESFYSNNYQTVIRYNPQNSRKPNTQCLANLKYIDSNKRQSALFYNQTINAKLRIKLHAQSQHSITFVGLYEKAIPSGPPAEGLALFGIDDISIPYMPPGEYYVMACELRLNTNPIHYFVLDSAKRAIFRQPIRFPITQNQTIELTLREKEPDDPPININLLQLLYESLN